MNDISIVFSLIFHAEGHKKGKSIKHIRKSLKIRIAILEYTGKYSDRHQRIFEIPQKIRENTYRARKVYG